MNTIMALRKFNIIEEFSYQLPNQKVICSFPVPDIKKQSRYFQ